YFAFVLLLLSSPPRSTLLPYTRSSDLVLAVRLRVRVVAAADEDRLLDVRLEAHPLARQVAERGGGHPVHHPAAQEALLEGRPDVDPKSTRLNSSHAKTSYAVFCLKIQT